MSEINWEHHIAGARGVHNWARRFLKNLCDNSREQVLREQAQKDVLLDLLLAKRKSLVSGVVAVFATATIKEMHNTDPIKGSCLKSLLTEEKAPGKPRLWM